jgi:hypothetical protein
MSLWGTRVNISLPVADGVTTVLSVHFELTVPQFKGDDWQRQARDYYRIHAAALVEALGDHAPGGLFDAVLGEMAHRRSSLLRIPENHATDTEGAL